MKEFSNEYNRQIKNLEKSNDQSQSQIDQLFKERDQLFKHNTELTKGINQLNKKVKDTYILFNNKNNEFKNIIQAHKNKLTQYKNRIILLKRKIDELYETNNYNNYWGNKDNSVILKNKNKSDHFNIYGRMSKNVRKNNRYNLKTDSNINDSKKTFIEDYRKILDSF